MYADDAERVGESLPVETEKKQQGPKKRGRPGKRDSKDWQDDEVFMLINLWSTKEELFNCRDENYQNRDNRLKAITSIRDALITEGFEVDNKQIQEKMTNLRNYFAAELRKMEASKKSGAGTSSVYKSPWKFFNHLNFLQDNFTPRQTSSNLPKIMEWQTHHILYLMLHQRSMQGKVKMHSTALQRK